MVRLPLEGIRIVDLTGVWAGPFATQMLADWGAEVIWVESRQILSTRQYQGPGSGGGVKGRLVSAPPDRKPGERPWNRNPRVNCHARNKLSMTIDLKRPEGINVFKRLVKVSDVVMENRGPGTMEKLGIPYEVLKQVKRDIIMVRMPGFGLTGPYKDFRSFGFQIDNFAGQAFLMGYRDCDASQIAGSSFSDGTAGVMAALSVLMALHHRNRTGEGQFIEVAQVETLIPYFGESIMDWTMNQSIQDKLGNRDPSAVQGCYRCKGEDRWVNITIASDDEWERFCRALGNPPWCKQDRFSDALIRYKNHDELDKSIEEWTNQHDDYEVMHILQSEGVPAGPVMGERDCYNDPHLRERGFFQELTQADCGTHLYPGLEWKMSETPNRIRTPPCLMGENNEYVYKQIIGVSDEEYSELEKAGHIGMDFDPLLFPDS